MITVHLILNAHIDPVWLWPWQSGLDALLATCRNACDRLDAHPDLHFVRNEAWACREIERVDPALFERIRRHIEGGRWHIVGGWWLQPDCNGPGIEGLRRQTQLGRAYFESRFGRFTRVGYNVDSFGHSAALPGLLRENGQDRYVFLRPQEHEMGLPARLFRWRGYADGPEVVAFRIARAYTTRELSEEHVLDSTRDLPPGVEHTMCFVGLGDHGGGPSENQIAWCRANADRIPGCRLVFSHVEAFFDAVAGETDRLPLVVGELQMHSVGCYSVHRAVKVGVHRAEDRLLQAEIVRQHDPRPEAGDEAQLREAWRRVCFAHFHDTYGGTCIPSAYEQVHDQVAAARAAADELAHHGFRRLIWLLSEDRRQQIVLFNASDVAYEGYVEHEPWFEWQRWQPHWRLIDERHHVVPHQQVATEALVRDDWVYGTRLLFRVSIGPRKIRVLRIATDSPASALCTSRARAASGAIENDASAGADPARERMTLGGRTLPLPALELIADPTDTWTHETDRYDGPLVATADWGEPTHPDTGPLAASLCREGRIGESRLQAEYRVYAGEPFVEWRLRVDWRERHRVLKLTWEWPARLNGRDDGIAGGILRREADARERPLREFTLLHLADGMRLGVVAPEVYALDASATRLRLTLLRSPLMAHHAPHDGRHPRGVYADQGPHEFRFRFFCAEGLTVPLLEAHAAMMKRPPLAADVTRGMRPM